MKKKKSAARSRSTRPQSEPRALIAVLASKHFEDQTKRMLGTHYANKHGVRRER